MTGPAVDRSFFIADGEAANRICSRCRTARFRMRAQFDSLPCCHRSWANHGKPYFPHGYERTFEIEFACAETEPGSGLVVESSSVMEIRSALRYEFDHTTLIARDDPQRDLFEMLTERGAIDPRLWTTRAWRARRPG